MLSVEPAPVQRDHDHQK